MATTLDRDVFAHQVAVIVDRCLPHESSPDVRLDDFAPHDHWACLVHARLVWDDWQQDPRAGLPWQTLGDVQVAARDSGASYTIFADGFAWYVSANRITRMTRRLPAAVPLVTLGADRVGLEAARRALMANGRMPALCRDIPADEIDGWGCLSDVLQTAQQYRNWSA